MDVVPVIPIVHCQQRHGWLELGPIAFTLGLDMLSPTLSRERAALGVVLGFKLLNVASEEYFGRTR
jgi:hypothetical protein